mmetsp:Transcript_45461/g.85278  ORF Transcript_45461/g.85278 Transcript_45461/m.85278 type:complete len:180 (-) Transcript_45461:113-652(-)
MNVASDSCRVHVTTLGETFDVVVPYGATVAQVKACLQSGTHATPGCKDVTLLRGCEVLENDAIAPQEVALVRSLSHPGTEALMDLLAQGKQALPSMSSQGIDYTRTWAIPTGCEVKPPPKNGWLSVPPVPHNCDSITLLVDVAVAGPQTTFQYFTLLWNPKEEKWRMRDHGVTMMSEAR